MTDDAELVREALEYCRRDDVYHPAIAALSRLTARLDAERWQPIASAPAYTALFLAAKPYPNEAWKYGVGWYVIFDGSRLWTEWPWAFEPTHYQLPVPPETGHGS